jgi:adenine-specific DNA methylase
MSGKYEYIYELGADTLRGLTRNEEEWRVFLKSAAWTYKYSFEERVLLHAQRPGAVAAAPIGLWNRLGRWVNKGANGIALIGENTRIRYVFDIADTSARSETAVPYLWEMRDEYEGRVREVLENSFGEIEGQTPKIYDFSQFIVKIAENAVRDNIIDYRDDFLRFREGSLAGESDELSAGRFFGDLVYDSVVYTVMSRLGLDTGAYFTREDFFGIGELDTADTAAVLGNATGGISEMLLSVIAREVRAIERERTITGKATPIEKLFDKNKNLPYNETEKQNENAYERSGENNAKGTDVQSGGRLSGTRFENGGEEGGFGEIRQNEAVISQGIRESDIQRTVAHGEIVGTFGGNRGAGEGASGNDSIKNSAGGGRERGNESVRPNEVGGLNEQHKASGGGNGSDGTGIQSIQGIQLGTARQLKNSVQERDGGNAVPFSRNNKAFPTVREQVSFIDMMSGNSDASVNESGYSPLFREYLRLKQQARNDILMFRLGDFYEMYNDDALIASDVLGITITTRDNGSGERVPMCGVPAHILDEYIKKLVDGGYTVSVSETGGLKREITRNVPERKTPATPVKKQSGVVFAGEIETVEVKTEKEPPQTSKTRNTQAFELLPEIPAEKRKNFQITDNELGRGGAKTKYRYNIEAIRLIKQPEAENRLANAEEQSALSKYVGWGSLQQAFDKDANGWENEYAELKNLLTEEEYASARRTTLNAHYTTPTVIKAIYKAVENMGFQSGNILEPSCGTGNFFGLLPESMRESKLYGVELDGLTGRIAKQLYQKNKIAVQGYEKTDFPDSFFDLAVGNVPFGNYQLSDARYDRHKFFIHDYFFAKTLDKVRPGGIIAFVTSKGTLDKQNPAVRKYIAQRADLLGAVRLPNNAFLENAGTRVTADIIFLKKRAALNDVEPSWVYLGETDEHLPVNSYFAQHPEMVLGKMTRDNRMYGNGNETTCEPFPGAGLEKQLDAAIQNIRGDYAVLELEQAAEEDKSIPASPDVRNFSYTAVDGKIYYRENSRMSLVETSETASNRIKGMIEIRDSARAVIEYQTEDMPDGLIKREQSRLSFLYDKFTKKYGLLSGRGNAMAFSGDSAYPLLCSLEILDEEGKLKRKADMFTKRTIRTRAPATHADTASDALGISIGEKARVDLEFMRELTGISEEKLISDLKGVIFQIPQE